MTADLFCPECFAHLATDACACTPKEQPVAVPRGSRTCITRVTSMRPQTGEAWELLDASHYDGPRIHPVQVPSHSRSTARLRGGHWLWLVHVDWRELSLERIRDGVSDRDAGVGRMLAQSSMLILDLTNDAPMGSALDGLAAFIFAWGLRFTAVAVTGGNRGALDDASGRMSTVCSQVRGFPTGQEALSWLLSGKGASASALDADSGPATKRENARMSTLSVVDVGGQVGWQWLVNLHTAAVQRPPSGLGVRVLGNVGSWLSRIEQKWTGRLPAEIHYSARAANRRVVQGQWSSGTAELRPFSVSYEQDATRCTAPVVVGIGPLWFLGTRDLAAVLQAASARGVAPHALIRAHDTNETLWRWAIREFPRARAFKLDGGKPQPVLRYALESGS